MLIPGKIAGKAVIIKTYPLKNQFLLLLNKVWNYAIPLNDNFEGSASLENSKFIKFPSP